MKPLVFTLGLLALYVSSFTKINAQIYPDDHWKPSGTIDDYDRGRYPGQTRPNESFPTLQEKHDLDGDGVAETCKVEACLLNTEPLMWIGPAGKGAINALATWIYSNNVKRDQDGKLKNKLIVRIEPNLSFPDSDNGGYLDGLKVSFIRLASADDPKLRPELCFLPCLDGEGKTIHIVLSETAAQAQEKKMVEDYLKQNPDKSVAWQSRKGHTRKDEFVSFGGVWLGFVRIDPMYKVQEGLQISRIIGVPVNPDNLIHDDEPVPDKKNVEKPAKDHLR